MRNLAAHPKKAQGPKHAPGPWWPMGLSGYWTGPEGEFIEISFRTETSSGSVGRVYVLNCNEVARGIAAANANLVAASPEMYDALKGTVEALQRIADQCGLIAQHGDALDAGLKAIAKAEGRHA